MATDATLYYYETPHSLISTLESEGHTDEWIRVTVRHDAYQYLPH